MKNNLRVERAILNISQEELATKVGVTRQTINAIELGKYAPSGVVMMKIAAICNKSVNEIFSLELSDWVATATGK
jgi:putative transcriptional regulator